MYFEKLVKYKPEAARYMAEYYREEKKDEENFEKWAKYGAEKGVWELMYDLGVFYDQKNRLKEAEEWYLKSLEINPSNRDALNNLGITYGKQENYDEAEKYFKKIGREESGKYIMATYYETAKQYEKAEKLYKELLDEEDVDGYFGLGDLYRKTNRIKEAKEILKIGAEKGDLKAMYALGIVYYDESNHSEARKYFLMGAEKNHINSIYMVGATYEFQKNYTEARKWYEKAYNMGDEEAGKILKELKGKKDGV
jgi:tetratricopeptide repeat protein